MKSSTLYCLIAVSLAIFVGAPAIAQSVRIEASASQVEPEVEVVFDVYVTGSPSASVYGAEVLIDLGPGFALSSTSTDARWGYSIRKSPTATQVNFAVTASEAVPEDLQADPPVIGVAAKPPCEGDCKIGTIRGKYETEGIKQVAFVQSGTQLRKTGTRDETTGALEALRVEDFGAPIQVQVVEPSVIPGDRNGDGSVDDFELLAYIDEWKSNLVDDFELLAAIDFWKQN